MPRYKRTAEEAGFADLPLEPERTTEELSTLKRLRNMWEFASLMQFIFLFGSAVKIDENFDIEDLETECLTAHPSDKLAAIGLAILKYVSSHRGLTRDIFDEYTRRQYMAKAPRRNPFGDDEEPLKFDEFDVYTKIKVLQQLSTWTFGNVDRMRSLMPADEDHLNWRIEPLGWDKEDRAYFVLDDNRLYRRTDEQPPPPSPKPKAKAKPKGRGKPKSRGTRASKRRKTEDIEDEEPEEDDTEAGAADDTLLTNGTYEPEELEQEPGFGFTSKTWECIAVTLDEYQEYMASIFRSRNPNEKQLRARIEEDVIPIIEKRAEALRQKQLKKLREVENVQKMATAKRSSRLADKADKERHEREEQEAEDKKLRDLKMAHDEQERQKRIEEGHESRRLTREQRVREREVKRILHEEELAKLEAEEQRAASQEANGIEADGKRISERQVKTQREQHKKELERLAAEDGKWHFDCAVCGMHGENMDDGTHSIACDQCNVWQHSKCHDFTPEQAESEDFNFICATCKRKAEEAKKPKIPPLKLGKTRQSTSPESQKSRMATANGETKGANELPDHVARQLDGMYVPQVARPSPGPFGQLVNGPSLSPQGQTHGPPGYHPAAHQPQQPQQTWQGNTLPPPGRPSSGYASTPSPTINGYAAPHQHQHQYNHQQAVAIAGGHPPSYTPQYAQHSPHTNGYSQRSPAGLHPVAQPQQYHQYPPQPAYHPQQYYHPHQQQQTQQRPVSSHAANGYTASPMTHSPRTNLPPPASYQQQPSPSPIKSSPVTQPQSFLRQSPQNNPASLQHTPQQRPPIFQTPQQQTTSASKIATDGMAGPWPGSHQMIPQKHDQTPAPPSTQGLGETKAFPPATTLVPSPSQRSAAETTIPVKQGLGSSPRIS